MRRIVLTLMIVLAIITIVSVSCSSPGANGTVPNTLVTSVPYAFQDIINLSSVGSPAVEVILDAEFPDVPDKIIVYSIDESMINDSYVSDIAQRLGFYGESASLEPGTERMVYSYTDGTRQLEIHLDGSLRIYTSSSVENIPDNLPSEEDCVKIAREWLLANELYPDVVTRVETSAFKTVNSIETDSGTIGEPINLSLKVSFIKNIGDYELYSPGASVVIGENGNIHNVSINSLNLKEYGLTTLKNADAALDILKSYLSSPKVVPDEAKECLTNWRGFERLVINKVSLKYSYIENGFVQPIYVFEGIAYSQSSPEGEVFIGRVDAIAR